MNRNERILITKLAFPDWTINDPLENKIQREMWTIKEKDDFVLIASNPRDINKDTWEDYSIAFHNIIVKKSKLLDWVQPDKDTTTQEEDRAVIASRGFPKFFNWFEKEQVTKFVLDDPSYNDVTDLVNKGIWVEKIDGTCLLVNAIDGKLNFRTRKSFSVEEKLKDENPQQVAELVKLQEQNKALFDLQNNPYLHDHTIACEWVTPYNRILIDYGNNPKLYLIGIINNSTGELLPQTTLDELADQYGVLRPQTFPTPTSVEETKAFLEQKDIEGAVVYLSSQKLIKVKTTEYLSMVRVSSFKLNLKTLYRIWKSEYDKIFKRSDIDITTRLNRCQITADNITSLFREDEELNFILDETNNMGATKAEFEQSLANWQAHVCNLFYRYISYVINIWTPGYVLKKIQESQNKELSEKFSKEALFPFLNDDSVDADIATYDFVQKCIDTLFELDGPEYRKLWVQEVHKDFVGGVAEGEEPFRKKDDILVNILLSLISSIKPSQMEKEIEELQQDDIKLMSYVCLNKIIPHFVKTVVQAYSGEDEECLNRCIDAELEFELSEHAPAIIIMRGVSGSGKSTAITNHLSHLGKLYRGIHTVAVVSADNYFINDKGEYEFDKEQLPLAHTACQEDCKKLMTEVRATYIIIDNTNMKLEHYAPYMTMAQEHGYTQISMVPPDMQKLLVYYNIEDRDWYKCEGAQALIEEFSRRNKHNVTKEIIEHQCSMYEPAN